MRTAWIFVAACVWFFLGVLAAFNVEEAFVNDNVIRTIDLNSALVREKRAIAIVRKAGKPESVYYLAAELPKQLDNATVSYVAVKEKDSGNQLDVFYGGEIVNEEERNIHYYGFKVPNNFGERYLVLVEIVYAHAFKPVPLYIDMVGPQYVKFYGNIYTPSPYETRKQKTKITLASSSLLSYTKDDTVERTGKSLTYGPFSGEITSKNSFRELMIHFENNSPMLTTVGVTRELWLSHWGKVVGVEEWHMLRHDGARLKTQFSRVEFSKALSARQNIVAVRSVRIDLPAGATEVYYRDDIGNVSTSNLRQEKKRTVLELRPRFPLFGGWNYNWYHGYNLNLWDFVKYSTSLDKYVMDVDLVQGISDVPVDLLRVKVVLPEGATEIKVLPAMDTPVNIVKTFTYIDTIGRPTVLFEKRNLVDENFRRFQVEYKYPAIESFRKPLVLALAYLGIFIISMVYWRLDLTIAGESSMKVIKK